MRMGYFRSGNQPTVAQMEAVLSDFAELLSSDRFTLPEIASRMELSQGTVCVLLHTLCSRYGEAAIA